MYKKTTIKSSGDLQCCISRNLTVNREQHLADCISTAAAEDGRGGSEVGGASQLWVCM